MSRKPANTTGKTGASVKTNRSGRFYPVEQAELERQEDRLKKAAAAGKNALRTTSTMKVEFPANAPATQSVMALVPTKSSKRATRMRQPTQSREVEFVNVSFALFRPEAKQVSLCGQFNSWSSETGQMTRHEDGHWEAIVALRPGRYEYKFLVDGEWLPDPVVDQTIPNAYGSVNSVIEVWSL